MRLLLLAFIGLVVALPANWYIHFDTADDGHPISLVAAIVELRPLCETSFFATFDAHCCHFLHLLRHRDQMDQVAELVALKIAIETGHYHCFALIGNSIDHFRERRAEKLGFVDAHYLGVAVVLVHKEGLVELRDGQLSIIFALIMSDDALITACIPQV